MTHETTTEDRIRRTLEEFESLFAELAAGALHREFVGAQPYEEIRRLVDAGFGALTVPGEKGGPGLGASEFFAVLSRLAEADSNLAHAFRSHFNTVERAVLHPGPHAEWVFAEVLGGAFFGSAISETQTVAADASTRLRTGEDGRPVVTGVKYYSTGSIFADWINASATDEQGNAYAIAVGARWPGVERREDWGGFGQKLTGSGTTRFEDVVIDDATKVRPVDDTVDQTTEYAFYQSVLLSVLVGIGRSALSETLDFVRARTRNALNGTAEEPRRDPVVQELLGEVSVKLYAAEAALEHLTRRYDETRDWVVERRAAGEGLLSRARLDALSVTAFRAQGVVIDAVNALTAQIFEVGGASAVETAKGLDRHWRNARTTSSHNPLRFRLREIGDHHLNGTSPDYGWGKRPEA